MMYRDPIKITLSDAEHEVYMLSVVAPDGKEQPLYDGRQDWVIIRANALRAAIKQALLETLRGVTEQI